MTAFAAVVSLLVADAALVPAAQAAPAEKAPPVTLRDLPLLRSEPPPVVEPQIPGGDFAGMPGPLGMAPIASKPTEPSFDPARSTPLDDQTTPIKRVWRNGDGTFTTQVSMGPVRHLDSTRRWVDDDFTLVAGPDGTSVAKAAAEPATFAALADSAAVATLPTAAGAVAVRHVGVQSVGAVLKDNTATYPGALGAGADLELAAIADGFEESVIVADRAIGSSYDEELVLPTGVSARNGAEGVELVDRAGTVVATYGRAFAHDASYPGGGVASITPVSVKVTASRSERAATVASVTVGITSQE